MTEGLNDKEADKERQRWVDFVLSYRMTLYLVHRLLRTLAIRTFVLTLGME